MRQRSWWGWGWADAEVGEAERAGLISRLAPGWAGDLIPVPRIQDLNLRTPRVGPPAALAGICSTDPEARAGHTYGKAYRDVIRSLSGQLLSPPDLVAFPRTEEQIADLLDWAGTAGVAVIPYGGGSSVVGGVECRGSEHGGVLSMDLTGLDQLLEVDRVSRAASIQAGALGPVLERQLAEHGLTLRRMSELASESSIRMAITEPARGLPCRRASSSLRSAAGWPPGPAGTMPCGTRTSMTSWNPFGY